MKLKESMLTGAFKYLTIEEANEALDETYKQKSSRFCSVEEVYKHYSKEPFTSISEMFWWCFTFKGYKYWYEISHRQRVCIISSPLDFDLTESMLTGAFKGLTVNEATICINEAFFQKNGSFNNRYAIYERYSKENYKSIRFLFIWTISILGFDYYNNLCTEKQKDGVKVG